MIGPSPVIDRDTHCIQCSYNLRGLSERGRCPECGAPIEASLGQPDPPARPDPVWARSMQAGVRLYLTAVGAWAALIVGFCVLREFPLWPATWLTVAGPRPWAVLLLGQASQGIGGDVQFWCFAGGTGLLLAQWAALWLLTRPELDRTGRPLQRSGGRKLRVFIIMGSTLLAITALASSTPARPPLWPFIGLSICDAMAMLLLHLVTAEYACRLRRQPLSDDLRIVGSAVMGATLMVGLFSGAAMDCSGGCMLLLVAITSTASLLCLLRLHRRLGVAARVMSNR